MTKQHSTRFPLAALAAVVCLFIAGCSKPADEDAVLPTPDTPKEAATQVEQVFQDAAPEVQQAVVVASEGLRDGDYEKAVVSLQTIRQRQGLTLEQGVAVHRSLVTLEAELVSAMQSGDPRAKQAYETLKRMKRN